MAETKCLLCHNKTKGKEDKMRKKYCPIIKDQCIGDKCQLWVVDVLKITNEKTGKSGIKDFSNCALYKINEKTEIMGVL